MTFAMLRNAANGDKFLELSKLHNKSKDSDSYIQSVSKVNTSTRLPPLMRAGKELNFDGGEYELQKALLGTQKKKSKKEELIDKKIEYLLETYKK
jgi:hypothetical protein